MVKGIMNVVGCIFLLANVSFGQHVVNAEAIQPTEDFDNVHVVKIAGDSLATQFVIWVKDTVPTHHHVWHSETIYVLEGEAKLYIGNTMKIIKKGDLIFMPKQNNHAVKVISKEPMKVLSIQSPGFYGEDRVFEPKKE